MTAQPLDDSPSPEKTKALAFDWKKKQLNENSMKDFHISFDNLCNIDATDKANSYNRH
jgi:hypothetical protein